MKKVYIWNDLPLFFDCDLPAMDFSLSDQLKTIVERNITYLPYSTCEKFLENLKSRLPKQQTISIGTRPQKFLEILKIHSFCIHPKRTFFENGKTDDILLPQDFSLLMKKLHKMDLIHLVEDVSVSGKTLEKILQTLSVGSSQICVYLFCAFEKTLNRIKETLPKVSFDVSFLIPGIPIEEVTIFFLSDLLHGKQGKALYRENDHMLSTCFGLEGRKILLQLLEELQSYISPNFILKENSHESRSRNCT